MTSLCILLSFTTLLGIAGTWWFRKESQFWYDWGHTNLEGWSNSVESWGEALENRRKDLTQLLESVKQETSSLEGVWKVCPACTLTLPQDCYHKQGKYPYCKSCHNQASKEKRKQHKEEFTTLKTLVHGRPGL